MFEQLGAKIQPESGCMRQGGAGQRCFIFIFIYHKVVAHYTVQINTIQ